MRDKVKMINGFIVVDPIHVETMKGLDIINPVTGLETGTKDNYYDHPYQAMVVFAPEYFYNGGIRYESEVKEGYVLFFEGHVQGQAMIVDGITYFLLRYSDIRGFYIPTKEEREKLVFVRDKKKLLDGSTKNN